MLTKPISPRKALLIAVALVVLVGGVWALWRHFSRNPASWMVRGQVSRYLKKQARTGKFEIDFPFPSKAEMARSPATGDTDPALTKGPRTGKDFDTLAREYLKLKESVLQLEREIPASAAELTNSKPRLERYVRQLENARASGSTNVPALEKQVTDMERRIASLEKTAAAGPQLKRNEEALGPITADLWEFQRVWDKEMKAADASGSSRLTRAASDLMDDFRDEMNQAASYHAIYLLIGQQMWVADRLLDSANPDHQRVGITLALSASRQALDHAVDGWLAARICEGYIWPHLDVATDPNRRSPLNLDNLLNECADIFRQNEELPTIIRNYKLLLARADTPQREDAARAQIAMAAERAGEFKEALSYLRQIRLTNDFSWALRRIPRIEQQLKAAN